MRKFLFFIVIIVSILSITACNNKDQKAGDLPEFVEVELTVTPEKGNVNEPMIFEAKVTQGDEKVDDADEVTFEIWRAKDEKHEKIKVEHTEDGIYRLEKSFQQEGTYYIISHVTARDMHNMPKKVFVVGTPSEPEDPSESKDSMHMEGN
ncbi:FixH family protein [Neobacillus sp. DY30]|uniref:FixH family protein n=1 Tax=Neobacillus sp. DY30 TaxID=3047871 RepID=UPI0024BFA751|nr:FixH family protein [Neobacillus sp. DY30]WHX98928.1 FixH family protein [Neobacillus sp. DY30]